MKKNGFIPTNKDLAAIIRRLDLNADSKLGKDEFIEGIKPVEPYSKVKVCQNVKSAVIDKIGYQLSQLKMKKKSKKEKVDRESKHFSKSIPRVRTANPYESPLRRSPIRKTRSPSRDMT